MKAILQNRYGPPDQVLKLGDAPPPTISPEQVLLRVHATSVHPDIWHAVTGRPYALRLMGSGVIRPKNPIPGIDLAGTVDAIGAEVTGFAVGDRVFGDITKGTQWSNAGTFAELCAAPSKFLAHIPDGLDFTQAAAIPSSGVIAVQAIHDEAKVQAGQRVLINGAGGGVGVTALQLAKAAGAEVTAVDLGDKLEMLRSIGADHVVDYTTADPLAVGGFDLIVDVASTLPFAKAGAALNPGGNYILIGHDHFGESAGRVLGSISKFLKMSLSPALKGHRIKSEWDGGTSHRMGVLSQHLEAGTLRPVVGAVYALDQVHQALHALQEGNQHGKIVLTVP